MKKLLTIKETMNYLGIPESSVRRMINEHKVKGIKIGNKNYLSKASLDELYNPRPFNPQYLSLRINGKDIQVITNPGWFPFNDFVYMHDILFPNNKYQRVYDNRIIKDVINELSERFGLYKGIYIKEWRYFENRELYNSLGFEYSNVEDWYIKTW